MTNETRNDIANIWKTQPTLKMDLSLDQLRRKAQKLQSRVLWRNLREYVAGAIVIGSFGYCAWIFPMSLAWLGSVLMIAGSLYVLVNLHRRGAAVALPGEMGFHSCIDFHRRELVRQRDLLRSVWTWYLLPFVPGMVVFLAGIFWQTMQQPNAHKHVAAIVAVFAFATVVCTLVFVGVGKLNQWGARKLQQEIDTLDALANEQ